MHLDPIFQKTKPRLLEQVRERIRMKHYSPRTETAYVDWIRRFVLFHGKRHPVEMGKVEIEAFLNHLANVRRVSAAIQNQARSALLFLYQQVLTIELPWLDNIASARAPKRLPMVLSRGDVLKLLECTEGTTGLMLRLIYGTGMRLMECYRLRIQENVKAVQHAMHKAVRAANIGMLATPHTLRHAIATHLLQGGS